MTRAFLGMGSNLGDRLSYLTAAVAALDDCVAVSGVYETEPVGGPEQGRYLNVVVELDTDRSARSLMELGQALEAAAERVRTERWGPRTLDVDVLWVDGQTVNEPDLVVPHPRMFEREFVMAPLAELAPDLVANRAGTSWAGTSCTGTGEGGCHRLGDWDDLVSIVVERAAELRAALDAARRDGGSVGLVPTMGYLHEGHQSLVARSASENTLTVVSIFVNPLQFAEGEDYQAYPRDLPRDRDLAAAAGANLIFAPPTEEMYPQTPVTAVAVAGLNAVLEGRFRPTHFDGVTTVVAKLFALLGPGRAYFGEKDYQQLAIVRRMAADLSFPVEVVGCSTHREPDGLAMSSRNVYLTADERPAATVLWRALQAGQKAIEQGSRHPDEVEAAMSAVLAAEPQAHCDYAAVADAATLERPDVLGGEVRLLVAARLGRARLIDNIGVDCDRL